VTVEFPIKLQVYSEKISGARSDRAELAKLLIRGSTCQAAGHLTSDRPRL
jgi:hypothetical protein